MRKTRQTGIRFQTLPQKPWKRQSLDIQQFTDHCTKSYIKYIHKNITALLYVTRKVANSYIGAYKEISHLCAMLQERWQTATLGHTKKYHNFVLYYKEGGKQQYWGIQQNITALRYITRMVANSYIAEYKEISQLCCILQGWWQKATLGHTTKYHSFVLYYKEGVQKRHWGIQGSVYKCGFSISSMS